jgi:hypothetical protein
MRFHCFLLTLLPLLLTCEDGVDLHHDSEGNGGDSALVVAAHPEMDWMEIIPDPPEGGYQIQTPIYELPPYSETYNCFVGSWEHDMGVNWFEWFQDRTYGHHMRMDNVGELVDIEDGEVQPCLEAGVLMNDVKPYFNATEPGIITGRMNLPEGMGVVVKGGDRWLIQSHYYNSTDEVKWVQDTVNIGWVPLEGLEKPTSTWTFDNTQFELPPQEVSDIVFNCTWPQEVNVYMFMVHMHDRALSFASEVQQEDGSWEPWHAIPEWNPRWYHSPVLQFPKEPVVFLKGQTVKGTCRINNDTDYPRVWPEEMCVMEGLAYPLYEGLTNRHICNNTASGSGGPSP